MLTKDIAICIRAVDYSETSQIVTFFTRAAGKISAIAKGSKRPKSSFGGPVEIFTCGNIVFTDAGRDKLATLTEFESIRGEHGFDTPQNDLLALNCCFFAAELLNKLTQDYDPHPGLFDSFLQFLHDAGADENRHNVLALLILFQLELLKQAGLQPILSYCANCRSQTAIDNIQHEVYFSSSANGIICRDCQSAFPDRSRLSKSVVNCLSNLRLMAQAQDKTLNEIERVLIAHFTEILGHQPKMAKYFRNVLL